MGAHKTQAWRWLFWTGVVAVLALSLAPAGPRVPTTGWDKANHFLGFAALAVPGLRAYPGRPAAVVVGLLLFGGLVEVLQSLTPYRLAEWGDWLADGLGVATGWGLDRLRRR